MLDTPSRFVLQKPEICTGLMGHLALNQTFSTLPVWDVNLRKLFPEGLLQINAGAWTRTFQIGVYS